MVSSGTDGRRDPLLVVLVLVPLTLAVPRLAFGDNVPPPTAGRVMSVDTGTVGAVPLMGTLLLLSVG
jgi:hypothetical protein